MLPPAFSSEPDSIEAREFEQLIQDGMMAVKNGNLSLARKLLNQAVLINSADPRIWIWLSATTDDLQERKTYLEHAVASDPSNVTARRGLLMINGQLDKSRLMPEGAGYAPKPPMPTQPIPQVLDEQDVALEEAVSTSDMYSEEQPATPESGEQEMAPDDWQTAPGTSTPIEEATAKTYTCPNCGASISYDIHETTLVCQFCGFTSKVDQHVVDASSDQLLDASLPTERAHRWVESQSRLTCEQCGVVLLLPPGQTAESCPYCGANHFITSPELMELIDPQAIGQFKIDIKNSGESIKNWLGKGWLTPDDLAVKHGGMQLHPAYYPFWLFEGTVEVPWFCDVNVGTSKLPQWEAHSGSQFENFNDVLIPGLRKLSVDELAGIEPFNLEALVEFSPDFLAGWPALTYDIPLADASLHARQAVVNKVKHTLSSLVETNRPKRNFSTGAGKWSGLTYKLTLLPIYMGNYLFQGKWYHLLVNGQTGKVSGKKPIDTLKITMLIVGGIVVLAVLIVILSFILNGLIG
jgi:ribosomal protein S27AE